MIFKNTNKNAFIGGLALIAIWAVFITIEVHYGHEEVMKFLYLLSIICLFFYLYIDNQRKIKAHEKFWLTTLTNAAITLAVTVFYVFMGVIIGVNYKFMIGGAL